MNPIRPEDLFAPEFTGGIDKIVESLKSAVQTLTNEIDKVKKAASTLASTPIATNQSESTRKWANSVNLLHEAYIKLLADYDVYKWDLEQVTKVQRDQNQVLKLQQQYVESAEGSFNKMSAEYRLLKIAMNALSPTNEKQAQQLKLLQQRTKELYEAMNKYQQSTGKFGMQVGDYSKALNGLNLSTQQILREMPTLANSASQFFMAISNNVPIFIDNFKRARQELGSFSAALKGTLGAIFSWQTALLVLLTVLPKIAKAIHDKKKAQEEANKETKEAFDREKELLSIEERTVKNERQSIAELKTLYSITQDLTRSEKERAEAASVLQQKYPEILGNYSQEAILAGDAADAVDRLTNSLVLQARARGYLNVIEELSQKEAQKTLELQRLRTKEGQQQAELAKATARAEQEGRTRAAGYGVYTTAAGEAENKAQDALRGTRREITNVDSELQDLGNTIDDITKLIPTEGLAGLIVNGKGGKKKEEKPKELGEVPDYLIDYYNALIDGTNDAYEKLILQRQRDSLILQREYEKDYADLGKLEKDAIELENAEAIKEIHRQMELRTEVYNQEMDNLRLEFLKGVANLGGVEATDPLAEVRRAYWEALKAQREYTAQIQEGLDQGREIGQEELKGWQEVIKKKILAEAEFQKAKKQLELQGMLEAGKISQLEYEQTLGIEIEKIDAAVRKSIDKIGYKRSKKWNIWVALFGTDRKDETTGTITRELGEDVKYALDQTMNAYKTATKYIDEYIDALSRAAQQAVETANTEVDMARKVYETELEARANGYANAVDTARMEYEQRLQMQKKAQAESEKIQKTQLAMESASQAASLLTATANILASYSKLPLIGQALAIAGIATMWTTFLAAKAKAGQVTKYGEGMSEYLDYGGSHASGHDIDFGMTPDGRRRRVERGEVIGVINKRNVRRYGASTVTGIIDSLNKGNFEYKYGNAFTPAIVAGGKGTDLHKLESGVDALVRQGEYREMRDGDKRIIQYKNLTRTIR